MNMKTHHWKRTLFGICHYCKAGAKGQHADIQTIRDAHVDGTTQVTTSGISWRRPTELFWCRAGTEKTTETMFHHPIKQYKKYAVKPGIIRIPGGSSHVFSWGITNLGHLGFHSRVSVDKAHCNTGGAAATILSVFTYVFLVAWLLESMLDHWIDCWIIATDLFQNDPSWHYITSFVWETYLSKEGKTTYIYIRKDNLSGTGIADMHHVVFMYWRGLCRFRKARNE